MTLRVCAQQIRNFTRLIDGRSYLIGEPALKVKAVIGAKAIILNLRSREVRYPRNISWLGEEFKKE
jgi:hypothetical protein